MRNRNIESKTDIFVKKIVNLYEKRKARTTSRGKKESKDDIQEETDEKSFKDIESTSKDDKQEKKK